MLTVVVFVCLVVGVARGAFVDPTVWPEPASIVFTNTSSIRAISPNVAWVTEGGAIDTLDQLYARYLKLMFPHPGNDADAEGPVTTIHVSVDDRSEAYPQLETDESYTLTISAVLATRIDITAPNVYGVIRAVESLSQLIVFDFDDGIYRTPTLTIQDKPRYQHRGMLLDTARHYMPVAYIQHTIDALSYSKYNVLHWHAVDTQAFPFESRSNPKLWEGAYTPQERYNRAEIEGLVEYGRLRGVKIMLEFDVPGHAASWCVGYPEVCPAPKCPQPLNPASDKTLTLINDLILETTQEGEAKNGGSLFPYKLFHLGGDEVNYDCWDESADIRRWQKEQGLDDEGTYKYFVDKVATMTSEAGRVPVQWVEVFEHFGDTLNDDVVVHVWKDKDTLDDVMKSGYRAILSNQGDWYLDHEDQDWEQMYRNEPTSELTEGTDPNLLIGGESAMWAENVDPSDLDSTVWPRAAAVGEVLWTPQDRLDVRRALDRIQTFRCLLATRGVAAAPVTNADAREAPPMPGSCYSQRRRA
jgi:hexosaminidase